MEQIKCTNCNDIITDFTNQTLCDKCIQVKIKNEINSINLTKIDNIEISICPDCGNIFESIFQDMQCGNCFIYTYLGIKPLKKNEINNNIMEQEIYYQACPSCSSFFETFIKNSQCMKCISN